MESTEKNGTPSANRSGRAGRGYVYAVTLIASTGGFLFGFDLSIISGAVVFLREQFQLTQTMFGLANSSAILGCIVGPLLGLRLADGKGRKTTLAVAAACFMISAVGSALAYGMVDFVIWRALGGIGVGLAMVTSPMYIAELAPAGLRGRLITVNQLAIVVGINMAIVVAYFLSFGAHWRWMFAAEIVPIAALMVGLLFAPRSPRWLASKGRDDEALRVLTKINGREAARSVLDDIRAELKQETGTFRELFMLGIRLALMIGVVLMIFSQINGVNMILLYTPTILIEAGIGSPSDALLNSLYVNLCIFLCTVFAFWLVGKFGRRPILIVGATAMGVGHLLLGFALMADLPLWFLMGAMLLCTAAFTLSLAPLSWVIVAEIFPNRVRAKALSVVCFFLYSASFICTQVFPLITEWFEGEFGNPGGAYWIFSAICFCCVLFCWRAIPETKGLTLEEISQFWLRHDAGGGTGQDGFQTASNFEER